VFKKWYSYRLSLIVIILFMMFLVCFTAKDAAAFDGGVPISDIEMEETHGGFQMPNGNFVYFSMDFMHMDYLAANDQSNMSSIGTLSGILGNQNVLVGSRNTFVGDFKVGNINTSIANTVKNNIGITTVGLIQGNGNTLIQGTALNLNLANIQVANNLQLTRLLDHMYLLFN